MKRVLLSLIAVLALSSIPARADGWFPKVNSRGEIASGFGTVEALGRVIEPGWGPQWIDDDTILYGAQSGGTVIYNVRTGARQHLDQQYSNYAGGGGKWIGSISASPFQVDLYTGLTREASVIDAGAPFASTDGSRGYIGPYHSSFKAITVNGQVVANGNVMQASLTPRGLVYTVATGKYTRAVFVKRNGQAPIDSSVFNWEGSTSCDGPDDIWVLSVTQAGIAFRPAGAKEGFYWRGDHYNPSCAYVNGQFVLAFSSGRGELGVYRFAPNASSPRVRYSDVKDDCVECAPAPPAPPVTPPTPPVNPPAPVQDTPQAPDRLSVLKQVANDHPEINRCDEESLDKGRAAIVDWAAQRLNKAEGRVVWGRKSRGRVVDGKADRPNTDGLTYLRSDGKFEIIDAMDGGSCQPTWDPVGIFEQGQNGYWAPPQLAAEGGVTPPVVDPKIAELERQLAQAVANLNTAVDERDAAVAERDALKTQHDADVEAIARLSGDPCQRVRITVVPGYLARFVGTRCAAK